jgi:hypothetical protein
MIILKACDSVIEAYKKIKEQVPESKAEEKIIVAEEETGVVRKPIVGDCPICYEEMDPNKPEEIAYCKVQCGNNFHQTCWDYWIQGRKKMHASVTCVYCRAEIDEDSKKKKKSFATGPRMNEEGYTNLGNLENLPARRDYRAHHRFHYHS